MRGGRSGQQVAGEVAEDRDHGAKPARSAGGGAGVEYDRAMTNATLQTNKGTLELELFDEDAPKTVENFVKLARDGFYDGVIFHRVIPDFMIQGGDPTGTGMGGPGYQFEDEFNDHKVERGALAMANAGPNTNGSQFFIVTADACPWLDGKHTVFGRVTCGHGRRRRDRARADTDGSDRPLDEVRIESITVVGVGAVLPARLSLRHDSLRDSAASDCARRSRGGPAPRAATRASSACCSRSGGCARA